MCQEAKCNIQRQQTWTMGTKKSLHPLIPLLSRAWHICPPTTAGPKDLPLMLGYARERQAEDGLWPDAWKEMWTLANEQKG